MKLLPILAALMVLPLPAIAQFSISAPSPSGTSTIRILPSANIRYQDAAGHDIDEATFKTLSSGHTVSVIKSLDHTVQVMKIMSDADIAADSRKASDVRAKVGQPFPAFSGRALDGSLASSGGLRGKTTLVSFFFSECGPCISETPALNAFHAAHPEIDVLAVTFDDAATAKRFVNDHGLSWRVISDQKPLIDAAGIKVFPTMFIIGPDGRITKAAVGSAISQRKQTMTQAALEAWVGKS